MDLQMPVLDGVAATRRLHKERPDCRVIVLTTFDDDEMVFDGLRAGAIGYLLKDADADEVAASVRAAHRGDLQLDSKVTRPLVAGHLAAHPATCALTSRELDVLRLVAKGEANKAIAVELSITERTARAHVSSILAKLSLSSRTQLALWAVRNGFESDGNAAGDDRSASG